MPVITEAAAGAGAAQPPRRLYAGVVLLLLLAINIHNFIDRQIPFILAEAIKRDLRLSDTQIGVLGGLAFAVVYSLLGLSLGHLADRYGRKRILTAALVVWSLMTAAAGLAQSFGQLLLSRLGVAAGEAGSTPPAHGIIAGLYDADRRSMPMAVFSLGVPLGSMLGLFLGGWISDVASWRTAFFLVGAPGLVLALLAALVLREPARAVGGPADPPAPDLWRSVAYLWRKPTFRQLAWAVGLYSAGANATIVFAAPFLARSHGLSASQIGLALGLIYGIAGVAGVIAGGVFGDTLGRRDPRWRLWVPGLALLIAAPFTAASLLVPGAGLSVLLMAAPKFANVVYLAPVFVALQGIAPKEMRSTATAFLLLVNSLVGVGLGPLLTGAASDWLEPALGRQSLRYALLGVVVTQVWCCLHFFLAARTLVRDGVAEGPAA
jgi:predicted MFS family arabinose efflux permease